MTKRTFIGAWLLLMFLFAFFVTPAYSASVGDQASTRARNWWRAPQYFMDQVEIDSGTTLLLGGKLSAATIVATNSNGILFKEDSEVTGFILNDNGFIIANTSGGLTFLESTGTTGFNVNSAGHVIAVNGNALTGLWLMEDSGTSGIVINDNGYVIAADSGGLFLLEDSGSSGIAISNAGYVEDIGNNGMVLDGPVRVAGALDADSTLNVDGASTLVGTITGTSVFAADSNGVVIRESTGASGVLVNSNGYLVGTTNGNFNIIAGSASGTRLLESSGSSGVVLTSNGYLDQVGNNGMILDDPVRVSGAVDLDSTLNVDSTSTLVGTVSGITIQASNVNGLTFLEDSATSGVIVTDGGYLDQIGNNGMVLDDPVRISGAVDLDSTLNVDSTSTLVGTVTGTTIVAANVNGMVLREDSGTTGITIADNGDVTAGAALTSTSTFTASGTATLTGTVSGITINATNANGLTLADSSGTTGIRLDAEGINLLGQVIFRTGLANTAGTSFYANNENLIFADNSGGTLEIVLPAITDANEGMIITVKNISSGATCNTIIYPDGTDTIESTIGTYTAASDSLVSSGGESRTYLADYVSGGTWYVLINDAS